MTLSETSLLGVLLYLFTLCIVFVELSYESRQECFCFLESSPYDRGAVELLTCKRKKTNANEQLMVQCQQMGDLVRIGPILSTNRSLPNVSSKTTTQLKVAVANWGFADLIRNPSIRRLQLSLDVVHHSVDAIAMAGLESLEELLARTSKVDWESCSLANMIELRQVTLNCQSTFNNFLTFGSKLETLRFVNCEGIALQFQCITCIQDVKTKVVRIRPGPPLNRFMVRFANIQNYNLTESGGRLIIGQCLPGVCSDEMMCRNNVPLRNVRQQLTTDLTSSITDNLNSTHFPPQVDKVADTNEVSIKIYGQNSVDEVLHNTRNHRPRLTQDMISSNLSERLRYWIVTAILAVTLAFLVTVCVFISLYRHRLQPQKLSIRQTNRSEALRLNGENSAPAVGADTLSLPDVI